MQTFAGDRAEAGCLMGEALRRGSREARPVEPLVCEFVETKFRPLYMPTHCRPATRERYEALFIQGVLDFFGSKRLDAIRAQEVRAYAAEIALRRIHARNHLSIVRTVLRAAVEFGALEAMPELPPLP